MTSYALGHETPGYHVYYQQQAQASPWVAIDVLTQVASALLWKRHFGPIHLVCNQAHLETLRRYDVLRYYDSVNTGLLADMQREVPELDARHWAFAKIYVAYRLSRGARPFVILDTDLWLRRVPATWDASAELMAFHEEDFDPAYELNPYVDPSHFLPENEDLGLDWSVLPLNCALVYYNCPALVSRWYETCLLVIDYCRGRAALGEAGDMVFLEQRLLATLARHLGFRVRTLIPSTYLSQVPHHSPHDTGQWRPRLDSSPELQAAVSAVTHTWGLKKSFDRESVRELVILTVLGDLQDLLPPKYGDLPRPLLYEVRALLPAAYLPA